MPLWGLMRRGMLSLVAAPSLGIFALVYSAPTGCRPKGVAVRVRGIRRTVGWWRIGADLTAS